MLRSVCSGFLALLLFLGLPAAAPVSAYATDTSSATSASSGTAYYSYSSSDGQTSMTRLLPSSYYLTNLGLVTPAKLQSPWGTCWAFAAISAIESSILKAESELASAEANAGQSGAAAQDPASASSTDTEFDEGRIYTFYDREHASHKLAYPGMEELNLTNLNDSLDLSERVLAWFAQQPQSEASGGDQVGEGYTRLNPNDPLGQFAGGNFAIVESALAARQDLALEESAPYQYNGYDGTGIPWYNTGSSDGAADDARMQDWSVADSLRMSDEVGWYVSDIVNLPSPAILSIDYNTGTATYEGYDDNATQTIKEALTQIGGVAISCEMDLSLPSQIVGIRSHVNDQGGTFNYRTWSQYNGNPQVVLNHAVTIVGWDDDYSVGNFGTADSGIPPKSGAWLCKNNWGSDEIYASLGESENAVHWGISTNDSTDLAEQDASGFFWLSYYDHSLSGPVAFEVAPVSEDENVYQYDYLSISEYEYPNIYTGVVKVANVFTAEDVEIIEAVNGWTFSDNETINTWIYALPPREEDDELAELLSDPTLTSEDIEAINSEAFKNDLEKGQVLAEMSRSYAIAGFHTMELENPVVVYEGERFAIVQQIQTVSQNSAGETVPSSYLALEISFVNPLTTEGEMGASTVVANSGESYVAVFGENNWSSVQEYNDWYADLKAQGNLPVDMIYGNALIKAVTSDTSMSDEGRIYELVPLEPPAE